MDHTHLHTHMHHTHSIAYSVGENFVLCSMFKNKLHISMFRKKIYPVGWPVLPKEPLVDVTLVDCCQSDRNKKHNLICDIYPPTKFSGKFSGKTFSGKQIRGACRRTVLYYYLYGVMLILKQNYNIESIKNVWVF